VNAEAMVWVNLRAEGCTVWICCKEKSCHHPALPTALLNTTRRGKYLPFLNKDPFCCLHLSFLSRFRKELQPGGNFLLSPRKMLFVHLSAYSADVKDKQLMDQHTNLWKSFQSRAQ